MGRLPLLMPICVIIDQFKDLFVLCVWMLLQCVAELLVFIVQTFVSLFLCCLKMKLTFSLLKKQDC